MPSGWRRTGWRWQATSGWLPFQVARSLATHRLGDTAEVRNRPVARTLLAEVIRGGPAAADVARLATVVGLTDPSGPPTGGIW